MKLVAELRGLPATMVGMLQCKSCGYTYPARWTLECQADMECPNCEKWTVQVCGPHVVVLGILDGDHADGIMRAELEDINDTLKHRALHKES